MTRTDALLNLQSNGAELMAQGVTNMVNAEASPEPGRWGSRTFVIDLAGIAAGTAVNLSFDLIGFGKTAATTQSHVTVRDVRLLGLPATQDDAATGSEDSVIKIIALANDTNATNPGTSTLLSTGFTPVVVTAPAHGQVVINEDGSFSYTPNANFFGEDNFTYKLSNGLVDFNTSTVNLTVTSVNDMPVVADKGAITAEDTDITLDLLACQSTPKSFQLA